MTSRTSACSLPFSLQSLESRCLLSAGLENGVLHIVGTSQDDEFRFQYSGDKSKITVTHSPRQFADFEREEFTFDTADVEGILIEMGEGDDDVSLSSFQYQGIDVPATIYGGSGRDTIFAGLGNDTIYCGTGAVDQADGSEGDDLIYGNGGSLDVLFGGKGQDTLYGGAGRDQLLGGEDRDFLYGGSGNDYLQGDEGTDRLYGEDGNDTLIGGGGSDRLYGGAGNDFLYGYGGANALSGGSGNDSGSKRKGDDLKSIESIVDELTGTYP